MHSMAEPVEFKNDGREIYTKRSDCSLVKHWARRYGAKVKTAWMPKEGGTASLFESDDEDVRSLAPDSDSEKGDTVWAVPSSTMGAVHDASLITRFASAATVTDYDEIRRSLMAAGYPNNVLDTVPAPK